MVAGFEQKVPRRPASSLTISSSTVWVTAGAVDL